MAPLFQHRDLFKLHSGQCTDFLINCDNLHDYDLDALAHQLVAQLQPFSMVVSIPRGGDRLAKIMAQHITPATHSALVVDDVYTTGSSFRKWRQDNPGLLDAAQGAVIFARETPPPWIQPVFVMLNDVTRR